MFEDRSKLNISIEAKTGEIPTVVFCRPTQELVVVDSENISRMEDLFGVKHTKTIDGISIKVPRSQVECFSSIEQIAPEIDLVKTCKELEMFPFSEACKNSFNIAEQNRSGAFSPLNSNQTLAEDSPVLFFSRDSQRGALHLYSVGEAKSLLQNKEFPQLQAECEIIRGTFLQSSCGFGFYVGVEAVENISKSRLFAYLHLFVGANKDLRNIGSLQNMQVNLIKPGQRIWEGFLAEMMNERAGHRTIGLGNDE